MSEDKKIQKKIESRTQRILDYINEIKDLKIQLNGLLDEKQQKKLNKKIEFAKGMVMFNVDKLNELNADTTSILSSYQPEDQAIIKEIYPHGFGEESLQYQKQRETTIAEYKKTIQRIQDARAELDPYTHLNMDQRMKNKLFRKESWIGIGLDSESNPQNEKRYNPAWNYVRDIDNSPEFTPEEIQILKDCYNNWQAEKAWDEEHNPLVKLGKNISAFGEKVEEHSNKREAIQWAANLYTDLFPDVVKELFATHPLTEEQLVQQSKNMTKRYIRWATDPVEVQKLLNEKALIEAENKAQIEAFKRDTDLSDVKVRGLIGNLVKNSIGKMLSQMYGNEEVLLFALLKERLGIEKTYFLMIYTLNENSQRASELFSQYSFAELGLE